MLKTTKDTRATENGMDFLSRCRACCQPKTCCRCHFCLLGNQNSEGWTVSTRRRAWLPHPRLGWQLLRHYVCIKRGEPITTEWGNRLFGYAQRPVYPSAHVSPRRRE